MNIASSQAFFSFHFRFELNEANVYIIAAVNNSMYGSML